jgi:hypothetical protein
MLMRLADWFSSATLLGQLWTIRAIAPFTLLLFLQYKFACVARLRCTFFCSGSFPGDGVFAPLCLCWYTSCVFLLDCLGGGAYMAAVIAYLLIYLFAELVYSLEFPKFSLFGCE